MLSSLFRLVGIDSGATRPTVLAGHSGHCWCLALTDDTLFSGSADGDILAWPLTPSGTVSHSPRGKLVGHTAVVYALLVHAGGLVSGSSDRSLRAWDVVTLCCKAVVHDNPATILALASAGGFVFAGCQDGSVRQFQAPDLKLVAAIAAHDGGVYAILGVGNLLVSGAADGLLKLWEAASGDGGASAAFEGEAVRARGALVDQSMPTVQSGEPPVGGGVYALAEAAGLLYSGHQGATVRVWSLAERTCLCTVAAHQSYVCAIYATPTRLVSPRGSPTHPAGAHSCPPLRSLWPMVKSFPCPLNPARNS